MQSPQMNMPMQDPMMGMQGGQDPMMGQDPSMGMQGGQDPMMGMQGGQDPMMGQDPSMGMQGQQNIGNQFDTNFDAGVEADEDEDPKTYIQQLTGKLSQKLRSFNKENGEPDESLNKYVAKMIIKAAGEEMTPEDKTDLKRCINMLSNPEDEEMDDTSDGSNNPDEEMPEDDGMGGNDMNSDGMGDENIPMQETLFHCSKKQLHEVLMNLSNSEKEDEKTPIKNKNKKKPYNIYR